MNMGASSYLICSNLGRVQFKIRRSTVSWRCPNALPFALHSIYCGHMIYFQTPVFDLLKLGQTIGRPASRRPFARHVVDIAAKLAQRVENAQDLIRSRELLHDQISRLVWHSYFWIVPIQTYQLDYSIYPAAGYENVLPNSLLGTSLLYRGQLNSGDHDNQLYSRLMVRTGLEWACKKAEFEGRPNAHNDMPELDLNRLNLLLKDQLPSAA